MKCSKQEEIRDTVDFACRLKPEDLVWKPIYPNNILSNGIEGCYALVLRKDPDGRIYGRKYSILFQKEEDPEHLGKAFWPCTPGPSFISCWKKATMMCPAHWTTRNPQRAAILRFHNPSRKTHSTAAASMTTAALSGLIPRWNWQRSGRLRNSARCSAMPCPVCSRMRSKRRTAE